MADTPPGGCQGAGTITNHGGRALVDIRSGSAVIGGDFSSSSATPGGLSFRLQVVGAPVDMSSAPTVSWRIDGGSWHGAGLTEAPRQQGDPYWVTSSAPIGQLTPGTHRAEVSLTAPDGSAGRIFYVNGYFDTSGPCTQLAGWVSIDGVAVTGSGGSSGGSSGGGSATPPSPTRRPSVSPARSATPGPSEPSPEPSPSDSPTPTPSPSPTLSAMAGPSDPPSPSPSASPTRLSAMRTAAHAGSSDGLLWAAVALIVGATAAVGAIAYRRRSASSNSE